MDHIHFDVSNEILFFFLLLAFLLCAFCSASETGVLSLNRYRLRHLAKTDARAKRISKLLEHPDRLFGIILIGNTFATAAGSSIANEIGQRYLGDIGIFISPIILTIGLLIFSEVTPKTFAAIKPEATSNFVSYPLSIMQSALYPLVWLATTTSNLLLRLFGIHVSQKPHDALNTEELRTIVNEASGFVPSRHLTMLLSILDLQKVRVDHIMIPRNEVLGINLDDDQETIIERLKTTQHTLLPVYRSDLDNIQGILHTRNIVKVFASKELNEQTLSAAMDEPYFIPEGTTLHTQLFNFQRNKRRMALVVDEYGDVLGLVTLEDILEEIVGEFTTDVSSEIQDVKPQEDGSFLVEGSVSVRDLNRTQHWVLPIEGPTTLSGLIIETLEAIPEPGTCVLINGYPVEVIEMKENTVKTARISPRLPDHNEKTSEEH